MSLSKVKEVQISNEVTIGSDLPFVLFCGLNVIESEKLTFKVAEELLDITSTLDIPFVFKASYDKANRSSKDSFRGPGLKEGLSVLKEVKARYKIPVITDIHTVEEVGPVSEVSDVLQIPAFLCRQTDLVLEAAKTGLPLHVKKGQFLAPWDMKNVIEKIRSENNENILLCERGVSFGYNNLVVDMTAFPIMRALGYPVVFDVTHSMQLPTGGGKNTGGRREFIPHLSRAALACGIDGLFLEVHPNPDEAKCDGPSCTPLSEVRGLLETLKTIDDFVKGN
ncbi:MAG: 3-deoxy-8-phosphooctulonate synthase [Deltaproteobacteria bacterium RIFCSPHIGHO2_02_FULL_40_11]|nr:MAG: 3-deoxy-8-phosphooctulonate synthase [Deltaproteobacteria bacterium RIFCSPHIGHO2_02_FULL_40_11]